MNHRFNENRKITDAPAPTLIPPNEIFIRRSFFLKKINAITHLSSLKLEDNSPSKKSIPLFTRN